MNLWIALIAAVTGYLFGTISFARIVGGRLFPGEDLTETEIDIQDSEQKFLFRSVSATTILLRSSPRYGCLTGISDMLKATIPTLAFRLIFPDENYFLIVAAATVAGHNFPIFYGFKGGRGMSPLFGSLFVIDWLSIIVTNLLGMLVGTLIFRDVIVAYTGGLILMLPWFWFRYPDKAYFAFAVAVNILFWLAFIPELRQYARLKRSGVVPSGGNLREELEKGYVGFVFNKARERGLIKDEAESEGDAMEYSLGDKDEINP